MNIEQMREEWARELFGWTLDFETGDWLDKEGFLQCRENALPAFEQRPDLLWPIAVELASNNWSFHGPENNATGEYLWSCDGYDENLKKYVPERSFEINNKDPGIATLQAALAQKRSSEK